MEINETNNIYSEQFYNLIDNTLLKPGERGKVADKIGDALEAAEDAYLQAVAKKDPEPGEIAKAELVYKRVLHVYQSFTQMMTTVYDILRMAVNRLDLR